MAEGMLRRAMRVLAAFDEDEPVLSAAEIAERAGLPRSSVHRMLVQLVAEGVVDRAPDHRYAIGARLWELGELSPIAFRLRERALPHLVRLYEATGENVHLAVLDAPSPASASVLFAARITGRASVPTLGRMGGRHPLHTTGVGKALLATRAEPWLTAYLATAPLLPETTRSITDADALRADIAAARARGYAVTHGEMTLGNVSVAAPLGTVTGLPPIALGIVAHADETIVPRLAHMVLAAAKDLASDLRAADSR